MMVLGKVVAINDDKVSVHTYKSTSCSHCGKCGDKNKFANILEFSSTLPLHLDDEVCLELSNHTVLSISALLYLVPLIAFFFGYYIVSLFTVSQGILIVSAFASLILCFFLIFLFDKKKGKSILDKITVTHINKKPIH